MPTLIAAEVGLSINGQPAQVGESKPESIERLVVANDTLAITFGKDTTGGFSAVSVLKDGKELALSHEKTSSTTSIGSVTMMSGQAAQSAMASQVAQFLNVPFQEIAPPNMSSGININIGSSY